MMRREPASPQEQIDQLLGHLAQKNPYFALWVAYKKGVARPFDRRGLGRVSPSENSAPRAPKRSRLRTRWPNWTRFSASSVDGNRALPSLAFERIWFLHYPSRPRANGCRHAPFWECSRRSWRHVRPRNQLRNELVGDAFARYERSVLLPAEGGLVQRRRPDVGKAASSQRDLPRPGPLQLEKRVRSGVSIARDWQDISVLAAPPIRGKDALAIRAPHAQR